MDSQHARYGLVALALVCAACATLADAESGGDNLPNAAAGPYRALKAEEVGNLRSAPNVLDDKHTFPRDGAILDADRDPSTPEVIGYFAQTPPVAGDPDPLAPPQMIVRYDATDGRSFARTSATVLEPQEAWEGAMLGAPAALWVGTEVFLYYTAEGGIGLARSVDGMAFTRVSGPVLGPDSNSWEAGKVPANPGVVRLDDGSFRMFYDVPTDDNAGKTRKIGEARSNDGISWERVGNAAVLEPEVDVKVDDPFYDDVAVEAPFPVLGKTTEGRPLLWIYYGALDKRDRRSIGLAARYDPAAGAFERAVGPVFGGSLGPGQPNIVVRPGYSLLFVTQIAGTAKSEQFPAMAGAISPADAVLPPRTME